MHILKSESYKRVPQAAQMACLKLLKSAHRNKLRRLIKKPYAVWIW